MSPTGLVLDTAMTRTVRGSRPTRLAAAATWRQTRSQLAATSIMLAYQTRLRSGKGLSGQAETALQQRGDFFHRQPDDVGDRTVYVSDEISGTALEAIGPRFVEWLTRVEILLDLALAQPAELHVGLYQHLLEAALRVDQGHGGEHPVAASG